MKHKCKQCQVYFNFKEQLENHKFLKHAGSESTGSNMTRRLKPKSSVKHKEMSKKVQASPGVRVVYTCHICYKPIGENKWKHARHVQSHSHEWKLKCKLCPDMVYFKFKDQLRSHNEKKHPQQKSAKVVSNGHQQKQIARGEMQPAIKKELPDHMETISIGDHQTKTSMVDEELDSLLRSIIRTDSFATDAIYNMSNVKLEDVEELMKDSDDECDNVDSLKHFSLEEDADELSKSPKYKQQLENQTVNKAHKLKPAGDRKARKKKQKKSSCKCDGCSREDCNQCRFCLDRPKNGGRGTIRRRCVERQCSVLIWRVLFLTATPGIIKFHMN